MFFSFQEYHKSFSVNMSTSLKLYYIMSTYGVKSLMALKPWIFSPVNLCPTTAYQQCGIQRYTNVMHVKTKLSSKCISNGKPMHSAICHLLCRKIRTQYDVLLSQCFPQFPIVFQFNSLIIQKEIINIVTLCKKFQA